MPAHSYYTGFGTKAGITATPRFETNAEKYKWLNSTIAVSVGKGHPDHGGPAYDVYVVPQFERTPSDAPSDATAMLIDEGLLKAAAPKRAKL